jgi:hypothetical protein
MKTDPKEIDATFHCMAWNGISGERQTDGNQEQK